MRYTINHLTPTLKRILCALYIYPDGIQIGEISILFNMSYRQVHACLTALMRSQLATFEYEGHNKIWYPYHSTDELIAMINEGA